MNEHENRLCEALAKIAEVARAAVKGGVFPDDEYGDTSGPVAVSVLVMMSSSS